MRAVPAISPLRSRPEPVLPDARVVGDSLAALMIGVTAIMPFLADQLVLLAILVPLGVAVVGCRSWIGRARLPGAPLLFVIWVCLTVGWSVDPTATATGAIKIAIITLMGVLVAQGRRFIDLARVVALASVWVLGLSWLVGIIVPSMGTSQEAHEAGALQGLFVHRNGLGYFAVLATVTFFLLAAHAGRGIRRFAVWAPLVLGLASVYASQSRTAWAVCGFAAILGVLLALLGRMRRPLSVPLVGLLAFLVGTSSAVWTMFEDLVVFLGRDPTLTGRTAIWGAVLTGIERRPLQGYGIGALWHEGVDATADMWHLAGFPFFHAHNGYLDLTAQAGVVGLVLALVVLLGAAVNGVRAFTMNPGPGALWPILIVGVICVYNFSEAVAFTNATWLVITALSRIDDRQGSRQ